MNYFLLNYPTLILDYHYQGWIIFFLYLIHPGATAIVFQTFNCHDLGETLGYRLKVDYQVNCDSEKHHFAQAFAWIVALFFCVGLPLMFLAMMIRDRKAKCELC